MRQLSVGLISLYNDLSDEISKDCYSTCFNLRHCLWDLYTPPPSTNPYRRQGMNMKKYCFNHWLDFWFSAKSVDCLFDDPFLCGYRNTTQSKGFWVPLNDKPAYGKARRLRKYCWKTFQNFWCYNSSSQHRKYFLGKIQLRAIFFKLFTCR